MAKKKTIYKTYS